MFRALLLWLWFSLSSVLAYVDIHAQRVPLAVDLAIQRAEPVMFIVEGDDFRNASKETPIYVRVRLYPGASLAHTAVAIDPGHLEYRPVLLGMFLNEESASTLVAAPDTVELLRMCAGEDQWWVRINHSSSTWVDRDGNLGPPTRDDPVRFLVGWMAQESAFNLQPLWEAGKANLGVQQDQTGRHRHVPILLDIRRVDGLDTGQELSFYVYGYDWTTDGVRTERIAYRIDRGQSAGIGFSGDSSVGVLQRPASFRRLPQLTPLQRSYRTAIHIMNPTEVTQPLGFEVHHRSGEVARTDRVLADPGLTTLYLEPLDEPASLHLLMGRGCQVSASYSRKTGSTLAGIVPESLGSECRFALFSRDGEWSFDGAAMVNTGSDSAQVLVAHVDDRLQITESFDLGTLYPDQQVLTLIRPPSNPFHGFTLLESDVPMAVTHLRGTLLEQARGWCLDASPLALTARLDGDPVGIHIQLDSMIPFWPQDNETQASVFLFNGEREERLMELRLRDTHGQVVGQVQCSVPSKGQVWLNKPFSAMPGGSYVQVNGPLFHRAAGLFRGGDSGCILGHGLAESAPDKVAWYLVPDLEQVDASLHLINPQATSIRDVVLECLDHVGQSVKTMLLTDTLAAGHHLSRSLSDFPERAEYFSVSASDACFKQIVLRVPNEGGESDWLVWQPLAREARKDPLDPWISIPDERLKMALLNRVDGRGGVPDGEISREEALNLRFLDLADLQIRDFTGISHFENLVWLDVSENPVSRFPDLKGLLNLESFFCRGCGLTKFPRLAQGTALRELDCDRNSMSSLVLSDAAQLESVRCSQCARLETIEVAGCVSLKRLDISDGALEALDLRQCIALEFLDVSSNPLMELDISGLGLLERVELDGCQTLRRLHARDCVRLESLNGVAGGLVQVDLRDCASLTRLDVSDNQIQDLTVDGCLQLSAVNCQHNQLSRLSMDHLPSLITLSCGSNPLEFVSISDSLKLESMDVSNTLISELDLSTCTSLTHLMADDTALEFLSVDGLGALIRLECNGGRLTRLDLSTCLELETISCRDHDLLELVLPQGYALRELDCSHNRLESLTLPYLVGFHELDCSHNRIGRLEFPSNLSFRVLDCSFNQLERLVIPDRARLLQLDCQNNRLHEIVLSEHVQSVLRTLNCFDNQLTRLDPSWAIGPSMGKTIDCHGNGFDKGDCSTLQAIESAENITTFIYNPQADGSVLHCQ